MKLTSAKDVNKLLRELVHEGWTPVRTKKHLKMLDPRGVFRFSAAITPSDRRALHNVKRWIRKAKEEIANEFDSRASSDATLHTGDRLQRASCKVHASGWEHEQDALGVQERSGMGEAGSQDVQDSQLGEITATLGGNMETEHVTYFLEIATLDGMHPLMKGQTKLAPRFFSVTSPSALLKYRIKRILYYAVGVSGHCYTLDEVASTSPGIKQFSLNIAAPASPSGMECFGQITLFNSKQMFDSIPRAKPSRRRVLDKYLFIRNALLHSKGFFAAANLIPNSLVAKKVPPLTAPPVKPGKSVSAQPPASSPMGSDGGLISRIEALEAKLSEQAKAVVFPETAVQQDQYIPMGDMVLYLPHAKYSPGELRISIPRYMAEALANSTLR